jgi:predicted small metal-binding protein
MVASAQRDDRSTGGSSVGQNATTRELLIRCDCGFEAQGVEEALFLIVKEHTSEAHNAKLIDEEVLARVLSAVPSSREAAVR